MTDGELKSLFHALRQEHAETRRHFDVSNEATRHELRLLAESINQVTETLERTASSLDERIERSSRETQAMIKFSHAELDRRVFTLEETQRSMEETQRRLEATLSELRARIERLESPAH